MARQKRTIEELKEASNHLHYEVWMFESLARALGSGITSQGWLNNSLLESFTIHMRGIMDFLYNDNTKEDDVIAQDYFDDSKKWANLCPPLKDSLKLAKQRTGKEVAHLTYARNNIPPDTKQWPYIQIANEMLSIIQIFLQNVPKEKLGTHWQIA